MLEDAFPDCSAYPVDHVPRQIVCCAAKLFRSQVPIDLDDRKWNR